MSEGLETGSEAERLSFSSGPGDDESCPEPSSERSGDTGQGTPTGEVDPSEGWPSRSGGDVSDKGGRLTGDDPTTNTP